MTSVAKLLPALETLAQPVTLFIEQADGRKFRAELPLGVNVASQELLRRIEEIVGQGACQLV